MESEAASIENFASPRPTPQFFHDKQTFSTKKAKLAQSRGTPRDSLPPRPPVKSAPPVSRIFPHRPPVGAQAVSFRREHCILYDCVTDLMTMLHLADACLSPFYNASSRELYFDQCFEVIAKIGAGSFGEVFKVRSKEDGKLYAVKKSQEKYRGESDRKRKLEEVAKYEKLPPHSNLVKFYQAWEEQQRLYIQIELCSMSLTSFADKNHDIQEMVIWSYLIDLLMAVKHLHDHNLVHMDIKPDNIFITQADICKLGDFGLVLDISKNVEVSEAQEGDPKYLAPELLDGKFGKHADIFSLGMTMLELASDLDLPRGGEGWHILRKGSLPQEFLKTRSTSLKFVISQMLEPNHVSRPTVDQLLAFPHMRKVEHILWFLIILTHFFLSLFKISSTPLRLFGWRTRGAEPANEDARMDEAEAVNGDSSNSDDDHLHGDISFSNNSMGVPFDQSAHDSFLMPPPTPRRAFTAPVLRHRPAHVSSPISSSPVASSKKRKPNFSYTEDSPSSPLSSLNKSNDSERSLTPPLPRTLFPAEADDEKPGIEPKNLLQMFDAASDED
ncbi:hypothetical protein BaRGS_00008282 [Batillaria attramentaria]|uniref:Membrane-associated tyrosine- and threonine-specific cdc2-inhibitory kinase n=1 Tax=Batillaria attramentaria TaxID=370345 RepID=A0ABD0LLJ8_9CAEN